MPIRFCLRELIEAAGLPQCELARLAHMSPSTINRMCGNLSTHVSLATLERLSTVLGITPGELFEYEPEPNVDLQRSATLAPDHYGRRNDGSTAASAQRAACVPL